MKNFVKLSKAEMKMVLGGLVDDVIGEEGGGTHSCSNNGSAYPCSGTTISCFDDCIAAYGNKCGGCSGT